MYKWILHSSLQLICWKKNTDLEFSQLLPIISYVSFDMFFLVFVFLLTGDCMKLWATYCLREGLCCPACTSACDLSNLPTSASWAAKTADLHRGGCYGKLVKLQISGSSPQKLPLKWYECWKSLGFVVYFMCIGICLHEPAWWPWRPEKDVGSLGTKITDGCKPFCECWELSPLKKRLVLLTTELFL